MANFNEIEEARKLLGLGETATLKEIKKAYRKLAHRHHPDKHGGSDNAESETMKRLNRAYKLIIEYCDGYKYSFKQEDVSRTYPDEEYLRTFKEKWYDSI
ncbi:MAG: J domain-containing protein [Dehalococcoidales bacterium]|nr:J domain-containing protein [Dehalococcoidales bacterium]